MPPNLPPADRHLYIYGHCQSRISCYISQTVHRVAAGLYTSDCRPSRFSSRPSWWLVLVSTTSPEDTTPPLSHTHSAQSYTQDPNSAKRNRFWAFTPQAYPVILNLIEVWGRRLLNACPARVVDKVLAADDVVGKAQHKGGEVGELGDALGDREVHDALQTKHCLVPVPVTKLLRLVCPSCALSLGSSNLLCHGT